MDTFRPDRIDDMVQMWRDRCRCGEPVQKRPVDSPFLIPLTRVMETETWIERVIIQQLSYPDKRYKHGYRGNEQITEEFVVDCAYVDDLLPDGSIPRMWWGLFDLDATFEADVNQALDTLHEKGLIAKVREQPIRRVFEREVHDTTPVWEPTEAGLAEAAAINDAYAQGLATLTAEYDDLEAVPLDDLVPLLKKYGVVPQALPLPNP